jgi:hypothetical protein
VNLQDLCQFTFSMDDGFSLLDCLYKKKEKKKSFTCLLYHGFKFRKGSHPTPLEHVAREHYITSSCKHSTATPDKNYVPSIEDLIFRLQETLSKTS